MTKIEPLNQISMTPPDMIKPKTTLWNKGKVYPACLIQQWCRQLRGRGARKLTTAKCLVLVKQLFLAVP